MNRKLIIDGSAVYELDEECMLKKQEREKEARRGKETRASQNRNSQK